MVHERLSSENLTYASLSDDSLWAAVNMHMLPSQQLISYLHKVLTHMTEQTLLLQG